MALQCNAIQPSRFHPLLNSPCCSRQLSQAGKAPPSRGKRAAAAGHAPSGCLRHPHPDATRFEPLSCCAISALPAVSNGDLGTSAFYWAALGQATACPAVGMWGIGRNFSGWSRIKRRAPCWPQRTFRSSRPADRAASPGQVFSPGVTHISCRTRVLGLTRQSITLLKTRVAFLPRSPAGQARG